MSSQTKYIVQGLLVCSFVFLLVWVIKLVSFDQLVNSNADAYSTVNSNNATQNIEGRDLFSGNCASCHSVTKTEAMSISQVENRLQDSALLREWIHNSSEVLRSGNPYFTAEVKEYNGVIMPDFPKLTNQQIDAIIDYMREVDRAR